MIKKSKASVFLNDTLDITGLTRNDFVTVAAYLVRTKQAKSAGEAIKMLDTGTVDIKEIQELIIQSHQKHFKPKEVEVDSEIE